MGSGRFLGKTSTNFFYETKNGISLKADDKMKIWEREKERNKKGNDSKIKYFLSKNIFVSREFLQCFCFLCFKRYLSQL